MKRLKTAARVFAAWCLLAAACGLSACVTNTPDDSSASSGKEFVAKRLPNEDSYEKVFYVSESGNDGNTGDYDSPYKTIAKAKEEVAKVNGNMKKDIAVVLREGRYSQTSTLSFGIGDGGTNGHNVVYTAYPDEEVSVSGGVKLGKWSKVKGKDYYYTSVGANSIRHMYVNGNRATLARYPNGNDYTNIAEWDEDNECIRVKTADLNGATSFEAALYMEWAEPVVRVESVKKSGDTSELVLKKFDQTYMFQRGFHEFQIKDDMYAYYQNAMEFLDAPGEFYFNKEESRLYYYPREGEDMDNVEVIVPTVDSVFEFSGTMQKNRVKNIVLDGLTVEHTGFFEFGKYGFMEDQAGHFAVAQISGSYFGYDVPKGAIHLKNAQNIKIENCKIRHVGGTGINFYSAVSNCSAEGNVIYDVSSTAIISAPFINGIVTNQNLYTPTDDLITVNNVNIVNNYVAWAGVENKRSPSVANMLGYKINISHNEIAFGSYTGISNGWGWSLNEYSCKENTVSANNVHHVGMNGSDLGGIYNLNNQPGTVITDNYVHEINHTGMGFHDGSPSDGIYLDEGSNNLVVSGNQIAYANEDERLIYVNISTSAVGKNNTVENNKGLLAGDALDASIVSNSGVAEAYKKILPYASDGTSAVQWLMIGRQSNTEGGLTGYRMSMNETKTIRGLGRFYISGNTGVHKLFVYDENKNLIAQTKVRAGSGVTDKNGFEYGLFDSPVTLEKGKVYYIVGEETKNGDLYLSSGSKLVLDSAFKVLNAVKGKNLTDDETQSAYGVYAPLI